ncbi:MAG: carboxypeptidase regulatory-like domain-containing protein [Candidatus Thermoplasmatota archaeon]|nr:carboxypeptidase regulatory-like domain-containing protein [Candidatus Thermoplasmatota archaeon]
MYGNSILRSTIGIAIALALLFPLFASSEAEGYTRKPQYWIEGYITYASEAPVEGASVRVMSTDMEFLNSTITNGTGHYSFYLDMTSHVIVEVVKDGYLLYRSKGLILDVGTNVHNVTLSNRPNETVEINGHVHFVQGGDDAQGVRVVLEYASFSGSDHYEYEAMTDASGEFSLEIFPAFYSFRLFFRGLIVHEEYSSFEEEMSPYELDIGIPMIPEMRTTVKGYVTDGASALEEILVIIFDQYLDFQLMAMVDEAGYYEFEFWEGMHMIITMSDDYDFHFSRVDIPEGGVFWYNITLGYRQYELSGALTDQAGDPLEDIAVNFIQSKVFPDQNALRTDDKGHFSMIVSDVPGHLIIGGEDPFDGWEYETYFAPITVDEDMELEISLRDSKNSTATNIISFDGWEAFEVDGVMKTHVNSTRYMRLFMDLMMGDGDQVLNDQELEDFLAMAMEDDDEMASAPFGFNTTGNITLDGLYYDRVDGYFDFINLTGPVDLMVPMELRVGGRYVLNGTLDDSALRSLVFNMTYDDMFEETIGSAVIPGGWMMTGYEAENVTVSYENGTVTMMPGQDPDPDDDVTGEFVTLVFYKDELTVNFTGPETIFENESAMFTSNILDHIPDNTYEFSWMIDGSGINTSSSSIEHTFMDDGEYNVSVTVNDGFGRTVSYNAIVSVLNRAPVVSIEASAVEVNEGDTVIISVEATDAPHDPMMISWSLDGVFSEWSNLTLENSSYAFVLPNDGNYTVHAAVRDDDGGMTYSNLTLIAYNVEPTLRASLVYPNSDGTMLEDQTLLVKIDEASDPSDEVEVSISAEGAQVTRTDEGFSMIFDEAGSYFITLSADDGEGGITVLNWTILVGIDRTKDHDGDGIPMDWEERYGLSDSDPDDAGLDPDGDGYTNLEEYLKGTDPGVSDKKESSDPWIAFVILAAVMVILAILVLIMFVIRRSKGSSEWEAEE